MRFLITLFIALALGACSQLPVNRQPQSFAISTTPETVASVNAESTQQLLAEGKVIVAVSGEMNVTWFNHRGSVTYINVDGSPNANMGMLAENITAEAGRTNRNEPRYTLKEIYVGKPSGYVFPIENVIGGALSTFHLSVVPPGARKVDLIQVHDSQASIQTQQVMAVSFDDKISLSTLRRVDVEEGMARAIRIKNLDDIEVSRGIYIAGKMPNTPFAVTTGIVDTVDKENLHGRDSGVANNVAPLAGAEAGQAFGMTGMVVATMGSVIIGKALGSGSATAHIIGYHVEGSTKEEQIAVGSSVKGIKPGDKIRITRGSFLSKVEIM